MDGWVYWPSISGVQAPDGSTLDMICYNLVILGMHSDLQSHEFQVMIAAIMVMFANEPSLIRLSMH